MNKKCISPLKQMGELISEAQARDIQILEQYKNKEAFMNDDSNNCYLGVLRAIGNEFTYWTNLKSNVDLQGFAEWYFDDVNSGKIDIERARACRQIPTRCISRSKIGAIILLEDILNLQGEK